jgi:hypothetical protein
MSRKFARRPYYLPRDDPQRSSECKAWETWKTDHPGESNVSMGTHTSGEITLLLEQVGGGDTCCQSVPS